MNSRYIAAAVIAMSALAVSGGVIGAQSEPSSMESPATGPIQPGDAGNAPQAMEVRIVNVQGMVRVRSGPDQPWQPAAVDMVVGENAEFRTGPRSSVTCVIPPDQTFTLDRLGTLSVVEAIRDGKTVKTDLAMKYGRVHYDIEAPGVEHRAVIRSPSSTLAVRGTDVVLYDQPPFAPDAQSFHGRAEFGYAKQRVAVGGKTYAKVVAGASGAAETALNASVVDPTLAMARSQTDQQLIADQISRGAVVSFDHVANITVVSGGAGPLPDSQFALNPPGALDFYLRWTGNADLNLTVTQQKGNATAILLSANFQPTEILYPGYSLDSTPSGGHIAFDHRGGPNGGEEIGYWKDVVPGLYGISARNISGDTANFKFNVTDNGKPINIFTEQLTKGKQIERTLPPGQEIVGIVLVPPDPSIESIFPTDPGPNGTTPARVKKAGSKTSRRSTASQARQVQTAQFVQPVKVAPAPTMAGAAANKR